MRHPMFEDFLSVVNLFSAKKFETDGSPRLLCFPLAGFAVGCTVMIGAWTVRTLTGSLPGSLLAALVLPLLLEMAADWRGLRALTSFLVMRSSGVAPSIALLTERKTAKRLTPVFLLVSLYLFRVLAFAVVTWREQTFRFVFVFTGAYLIRGLLLTSPGEESEAVLETSPQTVRQAVLLSGILCGGIALLSLTVSALASLLLTGLGTWIFFVLFRRGMSHRIDRPNLRVLDIYGYSAETLLLALSLIG